MVTLGSIRKYKTASGETRYRVRWWAEHTQRERVFTKSKAAHEHLTFVENSKLVGGYVDPNAGRVTVGEFGSKWLEEKPRLKPSSRAVMESAWRLHVVPTWGKLPISDVRTEDVAAWVARMGAGTSAAPDGHVSRPLGPTSVRRSYGLLAGLLDEAVKRHRIVKNAARGVELPRKVPREHRYLTHDDVQRLAEAAGEHRAIVLTLAYTGLRWGELSALRVRDLDMLRRRLTVARNAVRVGTSIVVGTPKTDKPRSVPFPRFLAEQLARACEGKGPDALVFAGRHGEYLMTPTIREHSWFDRALERAELPPMTIHDLRHTAASLAVSAGANVKLVQAMLGHKSAAMTLDVYADLFDDDLNAVADRLDDMARSSRKGYNRSASAGGTVREISATS